MTDPTPQPGNAGTTPAEPTAAPTDAPPAERRSRFRFPGGGWRTRRAPVLVPVAALLLGAVLGAGAVTAIAHGGHHGDRAHGVSDRAGDGHGRNDERRGDGRADDPRGGMDSAPAPSATTAPSATPSPASTPAPSPS
jgi:hypothetical protein